MFDPLTIGLVIVGAVVTLLAVAHTRWDHISVSALWGLLRVQATDRNPDE